MLLSIQIEHFIIDQVSKFIYSSILLVEIRSRRSRLIRQFPAKRYEWALICNEAVNNKTGSRACVLAQVKILPLSFCAFVSTGHFLYNFVPKR